MVPSREVSQCIVGSHLIARRAEVQGIVFVTDVELAGDVMVVGLTVRQEGSVLMLSLEPEHQRVVVLLAALERCGLHADTLLAVHSQRNTLRPFP